MQQRLNLNIRWMAMDGNGRRDGNLTAMDSTVMDGVMATGGQQWADYWQWTAMNGSSTVMDS